MRSASYKTKQLQAILDYVRSKKNTHLTAAQIARHFEKADIPVARTSVYRNLEKLAESGKVRRYVTDGISGACYQYAEDENCHSHFHLKCEACGELLHLECEKLNGLSRHVSNSHSFQINMLKTVFYGTCVACRAKK